MAGTRPLIKGDCYFEDMRNEGQRNYVCDPSILLDIRGMDFEGAKDQILGRIHRCIAALENDGERTVRKLYIGKTYATKKKPPQQTSTLEIPGITRKRVSGTAGRNTRRQSTEEMG